MLLELKARGLTEEDKRNLHSYLANKVLPSGEISRPWLKAVLFTIDLLLVTQPFEPRV